MRQPLPLLTEMARGCRVCADHLPLGPRPVFAVGRGAKLAVIGQAPGRRVHESGVPWDDASGTRLREWLGIDAETFYNPEQVAILPMGFCFPGTGKSGDLPPRPECAPLWMDRMLLPIDGLELVLLIGQYAQAHFLGNRRKASLTDTVRAHAEYAPDFLPLPHPRRAITFGWRKIRFSNATSSRLCVDVWPGPWRRVLPRRDRMARLHNPQPGAPMAAPWTIAQIPSLDGKTAVVTGANNGIGFETCVALADKGAHVVMACRNRTKADAALARLEKDVPGAKAEVLDLDVADLSSVEAFARAFGEKHRRLDLLINNAGIMMVPYAKTKDGFERQMATNHLGHFALTARLFDHIKATPGARVVNVSSLAHRRGKVDLDDPFYERSSDGYSPADAYGRSKLANLLFTYELQRRLQAANIDAMALASHPGISKTGLADHFNVVLRVLMAPLVPFFLQNADAGALPSLRAATSPDAKGGTYFGPGGKGERKGPPVEVRSTDLSHDEDLAKKFWAASEKAVGLSFLSEEARDPAAAA